MRAKKAIMNNKTSSTSRISLRHFTIFRSVLQIQEIRQLFLWLTHQGINQYPIFIQPIGISTCVFHSSDMSQ